MWVLVVLAGVALATFFSVQVQALEEKCSASCPGLPGLGSLPCDHLGLHHGTPHRGAGVAQRHHLSSGWGTSSYLPPPQGRGGGAAERVYGEQLRRFLVSRGKVPGSLGPEDLRTEEAAFLEQTYPGLLGSPVALVQAMTSASPDSVVEADLLAGQLFECEEEESPPARVKRQEESGALDYSACEEHRESLGALRREQHPESSSCYWLLHPGSSLSYQEAKAGCAAEGGRLLDLSFQEELEFLVSPPSTRDWSFSWGSHWVWLSGHLRPETDGARSEDWRWDWIRRNKDGQGISDVEQSLGEGRRTFYTYTYTYGAPLQMFLNTSGSFPPPARGAPCLLGTPHVDSTGTILMDVHVVDCSDKLAESQVCESVLPQKTTTTTATEGSTTDFFDYYNAELSDSTISGEETSTSSADIKSSTSSSEVPLSTSISGVPSPTSVSEVTSVTSDSAESSTISSGVTSPTTGSGVTSSTAGGGVTSPTSGSGVRSSTTGSEVASSTTGSGVESPTTGNKTSASLTSDTNGSVQLQSESQGSDNVSLALTTASSTSTNTTSKTTISTTNTSGVTSPTPASVTTPSTSWECFEPDTAYPGEDLYLGPGTALDLRESADQCQLLCRYQRPVTMLPWKERTQLNVSVWGLEIGIGTGDWNGEYLKQGTPWNLPSRQGSSDSSLSFLHGHLHHGKATLRDKLLLVGSHVQRTQRASTFLSTPGRIGALGSH